MKGTTYLVYRYDPRIHELKLYWQSRDGKPLETFVCLNSYLKGKWPGASVRDE